MKNTAATCLCLLLLSSLTFAQNPAKKKAANQSRVISRSLSRLVANGGGSLLNSELNTQQLPMPLQQWLSEHKATIFDAGPSPFEKNAKWGAATTKGNQLFLHVAAWPKENKLLIPRLHNSVKSVRLFGETDELKLKPNVEDWEITLPEQPKRNRNVLPVVALELDSPAKLAGATPPTVKSDASNTIALHSRYSVVHGEMLRFEPQPHKNTVGYWVKEKDWVEWNCEAAQDGEYQLMLRYGCGKGQGGSEIEITVGEKKFTFVVEATGGFQDWRDVAVGTVKMEKGKVTNVNVIPKKKAKNAIMDIQQITLIHAN